MIIGLLYLFLTFIICFILIHTIKLAYLGFKLSRRKSPPPPKESHTPPPPPEPVYYIVEKKRSKKSTYSDPKEIKFKK